ncbi:hypothetical protein NS376_03450 [Pseudomonas oryzihabitans]|nr:hypothetical protein NS376_03450 [Pseudomonas psychrotolerans]
MPRPERLASEASSTSGMSDQVGCRSSAPVRAPMFCRRASSVNTMIPVSSPRAAATSSRLLR